MEQSEYLMNFIDIEIMENKKQLGSNLTLSVCILSGNLMGLLMTIGKYSIWAFASSEYAEWMFYVDHEMGKLFLRGVYIIIVAFLCCIAGILLMKKMNKTGLCISIVASLVGMSIPVLYIYFGGYTVFSLMFILSFLFIALVSLLLFANEKKYSPSVVSLISIGGLIIAMLLAIVPWVIVI